MSSATTAADDSTPDDPTLASRDEQRRQRAIDTLGLGVPARHAHDERLDRITRVARRVFAAAYTSITVLDGDQAWFPSHQGFAPVPVPRADTFCDRTTRLRTVVVVPDATVDPAYANLPMVRNHGIRFYAGVPLLDSQDNVIGTFCLFDTAVRSLSDDDLQVLDDLAVWAQQELVGSREMSRAGQVQSSLLPSQPLATDGWHVAGVCRPALAVGGDLFDYGLTDGVLHVGLGDVMGKGIGAALVGAGVRAAIRATHDAVIGGTNLGRTTSQVAAGITRDLERAETFVTLFQAAIDLRRGVMRYVDAGAGLCLVLRRDGSVDLLAGEDRPLGVFPDDRWHEHLTTLDEGDRLVLFSDGVLDLLDDPDDWVTGVAELVRRHDDVDALLRALVRMTEEGAQVDDVTAVAVFCGKRAEA